MSDVSHLFPQLREQLENWDGRQAATDGHDDPSHAGVTDEQVDEYLRSIGSLRAPLAPAISGQQVPPTPEYRSGSGRMAPPGDSYMEPPQAEPHPPEPPVDEGGEPSEGETAPPLTPSDYYDIGGRRYAREQAEAWAQFDTLVESDPQLRQVIQQYLAQRQATTAPSAPPAALQEPFRPASERVDLPDLPPEYADDATIQALHRAYKAQQQAIDRISFQAQQAETLASQQMQRTYTDIAQGAITEFQKTHNLDDGVMTAVARAARSSGFAEKYMQGTDPLTGVPVAPDPYRAVMVALNAGYMMAPETRELDISRALEGRLARQAEEQTRKQKLAGVSGASGSVPRTQTIPTSPQDARTAMTEEVAQMLNGSWVGDGS